MQDLPQYHKRAFAHNYHAPFIYHIILKKDECCGSFGMVRGDARIAPGKPGCAYIEETPLGHRIARSILELQRMHPVLQVYQFVVMPDHVHILLRVKEWTPCHLDYYMESLVANIGGGVFQPGYCDKPLLLNRSLDGLFRYIRENPHRLAMRMQFPEFFQRVRNLRIGDGEYVAYGNLFLLRNPDKMAVKISRNFSPGEVASRRAAWIEAASKGTVLVSPFVARAEKEVRAGAERAGGRLILVVHEAFGERYRPGAHDFELCCSGRLAIVSLGAAAGAGLSRELCVRMNGLAREMLAAV